MSLEQKSEVLHILFLLYVRDKDYKNILKGFSLKQVKPTFLESDSPTLI